MQKRKISLPKPVAALASPIRKFSMPIATTPKSPLDRTKLLEQLTDSSEKTRRGSFSKTLRRFSSGVTEDPDTLPWASCQQILIRILQGEKVLADERTKVANTVHDLATESLAPLLIDFCHTQLLPPQMRIRKAKMEHVPVEDRGKELLSWWTLFFSNVLPDLESVLYQLELVNDKFSVCQMCLKYFRDEVLLPCLDSLGQKQVPDTEQSWAQMLTVVELWTRDGAQNHERVRQLLAVSLPDPAPQPPCIPSNNNQTSTICVPKLAALVRSPGALGPVKTVKWNWDPEDQAPRRHSMLPALT